MSTFDIIIPSKPKIIREEGWSGVYEIDGFILAMAIPSATLFAVSFFRLCLERPSQR